MSTTHIAGAVVEVGPYYRQRCSWCGATLIDYDLSRVARPLEPGEDPANPTDWRPATWGVGSLVEVHDDVSPRVQNAVSHNDGDQLPANSCARLDPAVTV